MVLVAAQKETAHTCWALRIPRLQKLSALTLSSNMLVPLAACRTSGMVVFWHIIGPRGRSIGWCITCLDSKPTLLHFSHQVWEQMVTNYESSKAFTLQICCHVYLQIHGSKGRNAPMLAIVIIMTRVFLSSDVDLSYSL